MDKNPLSSMRASIPCIGGQHRHSRAQRLGSSAPSFATAMRERVSRRSRYRLRKQIVEPVFGQIKHARGFRQFHLRGLHKVAAEWAMICTFHYLLKPTMKAYMTHVFAHAR